MDSAALTFEMNQKLLVATDQVNLLNLCRQYHAQSDNLSNITGDNQLPLNGKPSGFELSHICVCVCVCVCLFCVLAGIGFFHSIM